MISLILSPVVVASLMQATINAPRTAFVACLKDASAKAENQKIAIDAFAAFASSQCAPQASALKSALVAFDVKNGIKRATAEDDAQAQIDDYQAMSKEKYEYKVAPAKPQS
jgi:hypothetical protein